ncbi:semaphorin A3 [Alcelaphine gammaherpesvirus 1]|nr:semaphorin A3 [Alcelaphine gammaherpesvirus 1]APB09502.1 semaphorin A3 [Alcelaphine gammaherpesvirus 1]ATI21892.1 ORFA3 [Alcelaphine gammaherpesvirus 1]QDY92255.1 semaphorin A3 [Alcelaphine gammaherpesvirus 1]
MGTLCVSIRLLMILSAITAAKSRFIDKPRLIVNLTDGFGQHRFFGPQEPHTVLFHSLNSSDVYVGGNNTIYLFDFAHSSNASTALINITSTHNTHRLSSTCENFITLLHNQTDGLLACGTNSQKPSCWLINNLTTQFLGPKLGLAPFSPSSGNLVLFDQNDTYSTINLYKSLSGSHKFRRIAGQVELYTSDTAMHRPQFVQATAVHKNESYDDKIYFFFQENSHSDFKQFPHTVPRVGQVCSSDQGGESSLSVYKWTTFLKARLACVDYDTGRIYNELQDIFIWQAPENSWEETLIYGLFLSPWNFSAVCVFTVKDIDHVFKTSKLKNYHHKLPTPRPGQCMKNHQHVPTETFQVADRYPEVADPVYQKNNAMFPIIQSKYIYTKLLVYRVEYGGVFWATIFYLTTIKGTIHIYVRYEDSNSTTALNILEINPFQKPAPIQNILLDNTNLKLYVNSEWEVSEVPLDLCSVYGNDCFSCFMSRDPLCTWYNNTCSFKQRVSVETGGPANRTLSEMCGDHYAPTVVKHQVSIPLLSNSYLSCPAVSNHADYFWTKDGFTEKRCHVKTHKNDCILLIANSTTATNGTHVCNMKEDSVTVKLLEVNVTLM